MIRLNIDKCDYVSQVIEQNLRHGINMRQATELIEGLVQTGLIGNGMKNVLLAAISDRALIAAPEQRNELRSSILREILASVLLREDE